MFLYQASITLTPKSDRHYKKRKLQSNILDEHICKTLNQILPNRTQQYIKSITYYDQCFIPECKDGSTLQMNQHDTSH